MGEAGECAAHAKGGADATGGYEAKEKIDAKEEADRELWRSAGTSYVTLPGGGDGLVIRGQPVMEDWEAPYMEALAAAACQHGGRVLEVGFGLGLSAAYVDAYDAVEEHVIVEANDEVLGRAALWEDEARRPTTVYGGFWQEIIGDFEDGSFSGVLFDAFPLSPEEAAGDGEVKEFFEQAARLLRPGGVFTFYFDAGGSWIECLQSFRSETVPKLLNAGFSRVEDDQVLCAPREGCTYFWKDRFLIPRAIR